MADHERKRHLIFYEGLGQAFLAVDPNDPGVFLRGILLPDPSDIGMFLTGQLVPNPSDTGTYLVRTS